MDIVGKFTHPDLERKKTTNKNSKIKMYKRR